MVLVLARCFLLVKPDLGVGDFTLVRPIDLELYPVWMGSVKNKVEKDERSDNFRHFHIQLWVSEKKEARNERELFRDCWLSKWKCNLTNPKQWVNISSILCSFLVRNNVIINSIVMISAIDATKAND